MIFGLDRFLTPRKKKFGGKKAVYQKKKSSSKVEVPSLARLGLETLALGLKPLGAVAKLMNSFWTPVVSILSILGRQRTAHGTDRETI